MHPKASCTLEWFLPTCTTTFRNIKKSSLTSWWVGTLFLDLKSLNSVFSSGIRALQKIGLTTPLQNSIFDFHFGSECSSPIWEGQKFSQTQTRKPKKILIIRSILSLEKMKEKTLRVIFDGARRFTPVVIWCAYDGSSLAWNAQNVSFFL